MFLEKKAVSGIFFALLLVCVFVLAFNIQTVEASGTIYIRADGSIDPPGAPCQRNGDVYTLTDNIVSDGDGIQVLRDNIVLDGAGFTIQASRTEIGSGINLYQRSNLTIQNIIIESFYGIHLHDGTSNVTIQNTSVEAWYAGIWLSTSSNNSVIGNTVMAGGNYGVWLSDSANYNSITGNTITDGWFGVILESSSNNRISGNTIAGGDYGIGLYYSSNNSMNGNNITNDSSGIAIYSEGWRTSNYNSISGNTFTDSGLYVWDSYSSIVENNTVNGRPLVYLEGVADQSVEGAGQVVLVRCDRIRVEGLNISRTSNGIELWETDDSTISGNNITANSNHSVGTYYSSNSSIVGNNITGNSEGITVYCSSNSSIIGNNITANGSHGVLLYYSSNSSIVGNNITGNGEGISLTGTSAGDNVFGNNITNSHYGIHLASNGGLFPYDNSISGNNITNNDYGILIQNSSNNRFYHNNIIFNSQQVSFSPSGYADVWNDGYPSGGNYWSDYNGTDVYSGPYQNQTGSDGIGDTPYVINGDNRDNYPLTHSPLVNLIGDITGPDGWPDGKVDIRDVSLVASNFGKTVPPAPANCDLTGPTKGVPDGKIDIRDISLIAKQFGEHL